MAYFKDVERFRDQEYPMLKGKTYLDYGGSSVYAKSLIDDFSQIMVSNLFANPHSTSEPAKLSRQMVDDIREKTLEFLGADPEEYDLVFTANATAAIKLVADCFRDLGETDNPPTNVWFGYHNEAHTSLVGARELSGTYYCFMGDEEVEEWLAGYPNPHSHGANTDGALGLFAFPGQSNMTGRRFPTSSWCSKLRASIVESHKNTYSLLDAAALAATSPLNFSDFDAAPDFTALSFYKIFGFPDLGALILRKDSGHILQLRKYFGGGTVNEWTVQQQASLQRIEGEIHESLEDGTLPFHSIAALGCAIDVHRKLYGSMQTISKHTTFLSRRLYKGMSSMTHSNGVPLCVIYNDAGEKCSYGGPMIAFNVLHPDGTYAGYSVVDKLANKRDIYLRSGSLCNPGGIARYLELAMWQTRRAWSAGNRHGERQEIINGKPTGVVRVSLGAMSTIADVDTFLNFLSVTFLERPARRLIEQLVDVSDTSTEGASSSSGRVQESAYWTSKSEPSPALEYPRRMESLPNMKQKLLKPIMPQQSVYLNQQSAKSQQAVNHIDRPTKASNRPANGKSASMTDLHATLSLPESVSQTTNVGEKGKKRSDGKKTVAFADEKKKWPEPKKKGSFFFWKKDRKPDKDGEGQGEGQMFPGFTDCNL